MPTTTAQSGGVRFGGVSQGPRMLPITQQKLVHTHPQHMSTP